MPNVSHKENHYVPKTLLKSWATKEEKELYVYTLNLKDNLLRKQPTSSIAKKKNLYTLPSEFSTDNPKIVEHLIFKTWEDKWPLVLNGLKNNILSENQIKDLMSFVIIQSFRTPKFERENKSKIDLIDEKEFAEISFKYHYAFLGTTVFTHYIKNSKCEILYIDDVDNFICSDNPSSHWLTNNFDFLYIDGILGRNDLFKNRYYKIICPVTPKHIVIISPNLGIEDLEINKK